jgi:hypothetical protein
MTFASSLDAHVLLLQHFWARTRAHTPHSETVHNARQYARTLNDARWKEGMNKDVLCLHLHVYLQVLFQAKK